MFSIIRGFRGTSRPIARAGLIALAIGAWLGYLYWPTQSDRSAGTLRPLVRDLRAGLPWYQRSIARVLIRPVSGDPHFLAQLSGAAPIQGNTPGAVLARWRVRLFIYLDQVQLRNWSRQRSAAEKLAGLGTNSWRAIPALLDLTAGANPSDQYYALMVLSHIEAAKSPAFDRLVRKHANSRRSVEAFCRMADRRNDSWFSISGLASSRGTFREAYRTFGLTCLAALGPSARKAVPVVLEMLQDKDDHEFCASAVHTLGLIGPSAASALPRLKGFLQDPEQWSDLRAAAAQALPRIDANDAEIRALLTQALEDERALVRVRAAGGLVEMSPAPPEAVLPVLTNALQHKLSTVRVAALEVLATMDNSSTHPLHRSILQADRAGLGEAARAARRDSSERTKPEN